MEKKVFKKILAILMILMVISTDFFVLGSNLVSYAAEANSTTNNKNISFSAYFKDSSGNKTEKLSTSIKAENLKLYAEIIVKNDGYFNGELELQNSNFNLKNNIISDWVEDIQGNKVKLKQINAGDSAVIELDVEPVIADSMDADMLMKASDLKLTGKYMETSYKGLSIDSVKAVKLNLQADSSASAELKTEIITNKVFSIDGKDKRVVQLAIKSRLTDNQYPIKQTTINVVVPKLSEKLPESIEVLSLGTMATNGGAEFTDKDWENKDGNVTITLKNTDSTIKWTKNSYDELVVTFIYASDVDANKVEITTNSEITIHNSGTKYTAKYMKGIENQEPNGLITTSSNMPSAELFKGQLNSNNETEYNSVTELRITNSKIPEKIEITEGPDTLVTASEEIAVNTKYVRTKINKAKMLEIFGQDGSITLKNGEISKVINKDSETDKDGNIVIEYNVIRSGLTITTSKPQKAGVIEFKHTKAIMETSFTSAQLEAIKELKTKNTVKAINTTAQTIVENSSESTLKINGTVSRAEFTVNKDALSTMTTNTNVIMGVKLITSDVKYDLFRNPVIRIQLPSSVEDVKINGKTSTLYAEEFDVSTSYDKTNKVITIKLNGEQVSYPATSATQAYLQLNLDIKLSELAPSKKDKFVMTYTNENATEYYGGTTDAGIVEKEVEISSPGGLVVRHDSTTYNITGIKGISEDSQLVQIKNEDAGKEIKFDISLINNTGVNAKNVKILGKLPTAELKTTLQGITTNSKVYYSENEKATADLDKSSNGWTTTELANAKSFLIIVDTLNAQSSYTASYSIKLPETLVKDATGYAEYKVVYDTDSELNAEIDSVKIGFATPTEIKIETGISAQVGNDKLNNGDSIKAGEVIKYTMTVKNNGAQEIKNVQLKSIVPKETVFVEPVENYQHSGTTYYNERTDIKEVSTTIDVLAAGDTYTQTYEVRAKSDITSDKTITNKTIATVDGTSVQSEELTNKIVASNLRVTIKKLVEESNATVSGGTMEYLVVVENITDKEVSNLQMQLISTNFKITHISDGNDLYLTGDSIPEKISISKIASKESAIFKIEGNTIENTEEVTAMAVVTDSNGNSYRSNKCVDTLQKIDAKISLTSPQNKAYIREGDNVEYNIVVENTGNIKENIEVVDNIPENLEIQTVYVNNEIIMQTSEIAKTDTYISKISNKFSYKVDVDAGNKATMTIITTVKNITEDIDAKTITNKAEAKVYQMTKATSEEVTHILKVTAENIKNVINGKAWLDKNMNGAKDIDENSLEGITVRIYNVDTNDYLKDSNGMVVETKTNDKGEYTFTKIPNGKYIILFEYDTNEYEPTYYKKDGIDDSRNSKVVAKTISVNGQDKLYAVTDTINLEDSIANVNIGLKEKLIFDLQLDKYISKISIQSNSGTKTYEYNDATLAKPEIKSKEMNGAVVVLEYTIRVKNNGEVVGFAKNIVDYLSNGLTFSSELNPDWYISGGNLYTKKLANEAINPGESKEVKLVLTKTMTNENTGVVNNRAEIYDAYNEYGIADVNSTPNNNVASENDMGAADVIIAVSTGGTIATYIILVMINTVLIIFAIRLMIKNKIIKIKNTNIIDYKKGRR